ncbi:hypothetical protein [Nakamurella sp. PAMC28650]|uniref:hypothetical protein n=1 Tax=Nakamurella sp. PAMC28650 TaxID=2762325 RepID=UPI00164DC314|nr:hypothetical protein [Nakamurella sp. PAMC28650]QNK82883.1 hypothetical protein H7F38_09545 [Nakamurella sp. PAMC28650]
MFVSRTLVVVTAALLFVGVVGAFVARAPFVVVGAFVVRVGSVGTAVLAGVVGRPGEVAGLPG